MSTVRIVLGVCGIVFGGVFTLLVVGIALGSGEFKAVDCLCASTGGMIALGGVLLLILRGGRDDWDNGGEW